VLSSLGVCEETYGPYVPQPTQPDTRSDAERRLYEAFRDELDNSYTAFHSVAWQSLALPDEPKSSITRDLVQRVYEAAQLGAVTYIPSGRATTLRWSRRTRGSSWSCLRND